MIPLTVNESKSDHKQKVCYICKKGFSTDDENKKYHKVRDYCHCTAKYRGAAQIYKSKIQNTKRNSCSIS